MEIERVHARHHEIDRRLEPDALATGIVRHHFGGVVLVRHKQKTTVYQLDVLHLETHGGSKGQLPLLPRLVPGAPS